MRGKRRHSAVWGIIAFALTVAFVVMTAVLVYDRIKKMGAADGQVALVMLIVIAFLALLCTVIDTMRRKKTVEEPVEKILIATDKIASGDFSCRTEPEHIYGKYNSYDLIMENINKLAEELEKSEVLKTDFISNVSHELKTPIAVIKSYATLLHEPDVSLEDRQKYAETLLSAAERLSGLITNILKLNKLENSEIHPELETVNLTESIASAVLSFEELIEKKGIRLECDLDDVSITSSPSYLEIIWNNLVSNAVKFTDLGGRISVSLKGGDGTATVKISDTGCGISADTGSRIFEKFYQADTSHKAEGNGLGLALVKRVIDILGGRISVESEIGKGTTFTIILNG